MSSHSSKSPTLSLLLLFYLFVYFILWYWGLNSWPTPSATPPALIVLGVFKIGSQELFAPAGFEPGIS
jgi:hypothetical protein